MHSPRFVLSFIALMMSLPLCAASRAVFDNDDLLSLGEGGLAALRAADMTGDGKPDVVALVHQGQPRLYVFPSQGDGTFATPRITTVATVASSSAVAFDVADVNADGKLDVALVYSLGSSGDKVQIQLGVGDGTFSTGALLSPTGYCWDTTVTLADVTNDGRPDVLTCDLSVFLNQGSGNFGPEIVTNSGGQTAIRVGHANGDNFPDVFVQDSSPSTTILPGNGNGTFGTKFTINAHGITSAVADFDGNGRSDVVFLDYWKHDLALCLATSAGTYPNRISAGFLSTRSDSPIVTADMNADGRPDIVAAAGGIVSILLTNAGGTPGPTASYMSAGGWGSIAVADFDTDGAMDVITGGSIRNRSVVAFMRGAAGGTLRAARAHLFSQEQAFNQFAGGSPIGAALSDVTGDGKLDAISLSATRQTIVVLPGNGDGTTGAAIETYVQHEPNTTLYNTYPIFADFDGNGVLDVALAATSAYWLDCWLANGDGTFRRSATTQVPGVQAATRTGDFDGDGHQDILYGWEGALRLYPGNGDGSFAPVVTPAVPFSGSFLTGDLNGDGKDDVIGDGVTFLGSASRTFTRIESSRAGLNSAALTDLNDDGHLDFVQTAVVFGGDSALIRVHLGVGDGMFQAARELFANVSGPAVPGDFNADGDVDLLFGTLALLGDGEGSFDGHARLRRASTSVLGTATGDLDGNGSSDILYANNEEHALALVLTWTNDSREVPVSITIGATAPSVRAGVKVDIPVTVTGLGAAVPSGAVVFGIGGEEITFAELQDGSVTGFVYHDTIGVTTLTARFVGDDFYAAAAASPVSQEVTRAQADLLRWTVPYEPRVRDEVRIAGSISSGITAEPTGTVTILIDGVVRGTGSAPSFDVAVGTLPAGNRTVRVQYAGDVLHLPFDTSSIINVKKLVPQMTFTVSPSGSVNVGAPVTLTITFADPAITGQVGWIVDYQETTTSTISGGVATFTTSTLPVGSHPVGGYYLGNTEYGTGSAWGTLTVVDAPIPPSATSLWIVTPCRLLDTRGAAGPWGGPVLASAATRSVQITGRCGIPAGAKAVALNLTAVTPTSTGFLALFPGASTHPGNSTLNYRAGKTRASNAVMPLSAGGILKVLNGGADVHVLIDVTGYFR